MFTRSERAGFTTVEIMVALAVSSLLFMATAATFLFSGRSLLATSNYVTLDQQSRLGLDHMSRDIRQADKVLVCATNTLTLQSGGHTIQFIFDPAAQTLQRVDGSITNLVLSACKYVRYDMFQRNAADGTYDYYPTATTDTCKVVQVTFACSAPVYGTARQNVSVEHSAKIVIRKQK